MEAYDLLMLMVLGGATVFGAWKGMAWQIASLASFVVSYFFALRFSEQLAPFFGQQAPLNRFIAMLAVYLGTSLVIWVLFRVLAGVIDRVRLREFDHQIGALFGLAKGVLLCIVVTFFAVTLSDRLREAVLRSKSGHYIAVVLDKADSLMPAEIKDVLGPYLHELEDKLDGDEPLDRTRSRFGDDSERMNGDDERDFFGRENRRAERPARPAEPEGREAFDWIR